MYSALHYATLHYSVLLYTKYFTLLYIIELCSSEKRSVYSAVELSSVIMICITLLSDPKLQRRRAAHCTPVLHCCTKLPLAALHFNAALNCTALRCIKLHCTAALNCSTLHCTALQYIKLHCTAELHYTALH